MPSWTRSSQGFRSLIAAVTIVLAVAGVGWCAKTGPRTAKTVKPAATSAAAMKGVPVLSNSGKTVSWQGREYKPIDDAGVYYYDAESVSGVPMPMPRTALNEALKRNGFHGMVRCELVDYVDCTQKDHRFVDEGRTRVLKLADGDSYRVTAAGGRLSWFSYFMKTRPVPGRPHLVVVQTINDVERHTTVSMTVPKGMPWAPPYTGEEAKPAKTMQDDSYHPDVGGCVYSGREYPLDGIRYNYTFLYYPKAYEAKITVSHPPVEDRYQDINGGAAARIWMFDVVDPVSEFVAKPVPPVQGETRKVAIYEPHTWFMYAHYGIPCQTKEQRKASLRSYADYLSFCGINQVQFHAINGSDVARCAWYDSKLYDNLQGNLFDEFLPIAAEKGIELVPIVAPIMTPYGGNLGAVPDAPDKNGFSKLSLQLDRDGKYADAMGCLPPDPLRPEVQEWLAKCFREILDRTAKAPNVPAIAFRVNGKIGLCYVGYEADKCGQDRGYSEWDISEFEKDTGIKVPRMQPTPYSWLRANAWEQWVNWRCKRMHDFWLRMRDLVRSYRPDMKLLVACDLPSEYPGYNIEWVDGTSPRDLMRHHGYDPEMFKNDDGIIIQRGMMISSERHFGKWGPPLGTNAWAHKAFNYADGVTECYGTREGQSVEYYFNYWEEDPHPDNEYGATLRTATPAPWGQFYFEPATYSIRKANVKSMAFMGWERASIGHEHDLRRFSRAYRALPYTEPKDFDGKVKVLKVVPGAKYRKPENPDVWVKWFGDRLAVLNDTGDKKDVEITIPRNLPKGKCLFDLGAERILVSAVDKPLSSITLKLNLLEHDLYTLVIMPTDQAKKTEAVMPLPRASTTPGRFSIQTQGGKYAGQEIVIKFSLTNTSKSPITNVDIDLDVPKTWGMAPGADGETPAPVNRTVASIAPGKSADFSVKARVTGGAGQAFWITGTVTYLAGGKKFTDQRSVVVSPQQPVTVSIVPDRINDKVAGDIADVRVKISNMLATPVDALLSFDKPENWRIQGKAVRMQVKAESTAASDFTVNIPTTANLGKYTLAVNVDAGSLGTYRAECLFDVPLVLRKAEGQVKVDGDPLDWDAIAPSALGITSQDFKAENTDNPAPAGLKPSARISWDDNYLYITCAIAGGQFNQTHTGKEIWMGDSVQIGIDSARGAAGSGSGFSKVGFGWTSKGIEAWRWDAAAGKEKGPLTEGKYSARSDGKVQYYEAAIPWSELPPFVPTVGRALGMTIVINYDRGQGRKFVRWYSGITDGNDPSRFASMVLR